MKKKLYKSSTDKEIAGVCGGLGEYFNIDPTILRVIILFLFLCYSVGFWLYLAFAIVLPYDYQVNNISNKEARIFNNSTISKVSSKRKDVTPDADDKWSDF